MAWQAQGLQPPARVVAATNEDFADEDTFTAWLTECCAMAGDCKETLQTLFTSWQSWCEANGESTVPRHVGAWASRFAALGLKRAPYARIATLSTGTELKFGTAAGRPSMTPVTIPKRHESRCEFSSRYRASRARVTPTCKFLMSFMSSAMGSIGGNNSSIPAFSVPYQTHTPRGGQCRRAGPVCARQFPGISTKGTTMAKVSETYAGTYLNASELTPLRAKRNAVVHAATVEAVGSDGNRDNKIVLELVSPEGRAVA